MTPAARALFLLALCGACAFPEANKIDAAPDGGTGAVGGAAGSGGTGGGGATPGACPALHDPVMVEVPGLVGSYCVDRTEVTRAQYAVFQADAVTNPPQQPIGCSWNTSVTPTDPPMALTGDHPQSGVDWCDASAYCLWAGKRLCGNLGGGPAAYMPGMQPGPEDFFFGACSAGGTQRYPYGPVYDPMACNGADSGIGMPVKVATLPGCEGAYPGLFDMWGNLVEWVDACDDATHGPDDHCIVRGGAFIDGDVGCAGYFNPTRSENGAPNIGFRCCKDLED